MRGQESITRNIGKKLKGVGIAILVIALLILIGSLIFGG